MQKLQKSEKKSNWERDITAGELVDAMKIIDQHCPSFFERREGYPIPAILDKADEISERISKRSDSPQVA